MTELTSLETRKTTAVSIIEFFYHWLEQASRHSWPAAAARYLHPTLLLLSFA